ncbi:dihydrofolate reductase family protein [Arthrobacter crystallopoietes]|uniref:Dihydrofolate reductase n=1 Tax=Crystallibacter crystallopoietes TaxID=37928 RepID=A0A1H1AKV4_9MICC|nr:dihydrofolate reductase family protein [Arthrobacter crystallopoietes]AUI51489.1 deaminase [Arthrobacter crystallopoietes]SDQ40393.1 Dihydrofolate reductase [Arthrobacter crystallopoietes]
MRKVTSGLFHSVDGVVEAPDQWQFDSFDDELGAGLGDFINSTSTVILGRVTYEQWADYWPTASDPFADFINPIEKFVASRTLSGNLEWQNSRLIDGGLEDFVRELKKGDGDDIAVCGSISVVRQLLFAGLLDSLTLMQHPVVAGKGKRLFEPEDPTTRLFLQDSQITSKGNVIMKYGLLGENLN